MINSTEHQTAGLKKAVIYARVASVSPQHAENACAQQEETCREFAAGHGYVVERVFRDAGVSGHETQRAGFEEMLAYLEQEKPSASKCTVIINDISRLALSVEAFESLRGKIDAAAGVLTAPGVEGTQSPEHNLMVNTLAAVVQYRDELGCNDS